MDFLAPCSGSPCNPCGGGGPVSGACCYNNTCHDGASLLSCNDHGGLYAGDGTTCSQNPFNSTCTCVCFEHAPFDSGGGHCYSTYTHNCDGSLTFSNPVDCLAEFYQIQTCVTNFACGACNPGTLGQYSHITYFSGICNAQYTINTCTNCCPGTTCATCNMSTCCDNCGGSGEAASTNYTLTVLNPNPNYC